MSLFISFDIPLQSPIGRQVPVDLIYMAHFNFHCVEPLKPFF